jgi:UDP-arabinose 4-epimerase
MTTIIVTGGAGYIGSHTCKALRVAGFVPVRYDNLERGNPEAVEWGDLDLGDFADIQRLHATFARHRRAAIVHLTALAYVGESNANPAAYHRNNVGGTAALPDANA